MNLRQSKRAFKRLLIHRCDVFSKKRVRVGTQWLERFVRVEREMKCRVSTAVRSNTEVTHNNQQDFISPYTLYCFPAEIKQDDRICFQGRFYEVKTVPRDPSFLSHHFEVPIDNLNRVYEIKTEDGVVYLHE